MASINWNAGGEVKLARALNTSLNVNEDGNSKDFLKVGGNVAKVGTGGVGFLAGRINSGAIGGQATLKQNAKYGHAGAIMGTVDSVMGFLASHGPGSTAVYEADDGNFYLAIRGQGDDYTIVNITLEAFEAAQYENYD